MQHKHANTHLPHTAAARLLSIQLHAQVSNTRTVTHTHSDTLHTLLYVHMCTNTGSHTDTFTHSLSCSGCTLLQDTHNTKQHSLSLAVAAHGCSTILPPKVVRELRPMLNCGRSQHPADPACCVENNWRLVGILMQQMAMNYFGVGVSTTGGA